jgi:hypothetical protein
MIATASTFNQERDHLEKRIKEEHKTATSLLKKKQKLESALWFIKSMVESSISHPETSEKVIELIADRIEELDRG